MGQNKQSLISNHLYLRLLAESYFIQKISNKIKAPYLDRLYFPGQSYLLLTYISACLKRKPKPTILLQLADFLRSFEIF